MRDGGAVVEVLDDVVDVLREAVDVGAEVLFEQGVVFLVDLPQRPVGLVGERRLLGVQFEVFDELGKFLLGQFGPVGQHLGALVLPPGDEHALQPANDDDRQDDPLIFVSLELAAQPLGRFPDVAGKVVELGFVERQCHRLRPRVISMEVIYHRGEGCFNRAGTDACATKDWLGNKCRLSLRER